LVGLLGLVVLGFELRAFHYQRSCSTPLATPPVQVYISLG
jgi:hypothetical protein